MELPTFDELKAQDAEDLQPVFKELALLLAIKEIGRERGLRLDQQIDFWTPWGEPPESEEKEAHQDLVWIHKVLPPNDKFDSVKAKDGYYTKLRLKKKDEFWLEYDPSQDQARKHAKRYSNGRRTSQKKKLPVKPPSRKLTFLP